MDFEFRYSDLFLNNIMDLKDIKIGVLGGGVSGEREISLISAWESYQALRRNKLNAVFIDIYTSQKEKVKELISLANIDLAFIALHGEFGEDGKIQQILEELDIVYSGSGPQASFLAMDKIASKNIFIKSGLPTPNFDICWDIKNIPEIVKYPVVTKPCSCGSSLGVSIIQEKAGLKQAAVKAFVCPGQNQIIIEEYIEGRELTVGILDNKPLAVVEIFPKQGYYDFANKYTEGKTEFKAPAELESSIYKKVQEVCFLAHKVLNCRHFSRVDIRLSQNNDPYVLEVNSIPGLTSHSLLPLSAKAWGLNFDQLILKITEMAFNEKTKEVQKA
ncbi:MAG: D-alanine--D-alanine ligase [Candidatus Omnitrophota bacterium]